MAEEHAVLLEPKDIFSLKDRPFQQAKLDKKIICSKCYENGVRCKFLEEGFGLQQHFRTVHRLTELNENVQRQCRMMFNDLHGNETERIIRRLSEVRLEEVSNKIRGK
jgi:hypothetical protein